MVIQTDGKIVAAGTLSGLGVADFALARYNVDGSLDSAFGPGGTGIVTTDFAASGDQAAAVALQADGKIVVTGDTFVPNAGTSGDFLTVRYETDGTVDTTFGIGGFVTTDFKSSSSDDARGMAIQPDGRILVVGQLASFSTGEFDMELVRYEGPPPHDVTFFLHGNDVPGTAGGFTMNLTAPSTQFLLLAPGSTPSWFSDPAVNGTFLSGATFQVVLPCTLGIALPKTVRLASTDLGGGNEQILGQAIEPFRLCSSQTIAVPVTTPATFANRRLKLSIASNVVVHLPLQLGSHTFVRGTTFVGAP